MKRHLLLLSFLHLISCGKGNADFSPEKSKILSRTARGNLPLLHKDKNTVRERFSAPINYTWVPSAPKTYGDYLENFKLKKYGTPILKFNGDPGATQNLHEAVFNLDVGTKDLQQCADAIIRLRAEYLYKNKADAAIAFHFTSGDLFSWQDYKSGIRPVVYGSKVSFKRKAAADDSRQSFRNYLDVIFTYAGTISLFKESRTITNPADLQTGDFLITPGSPGHVVFITGVSKDKNGKKLYLLAEGFTPAQSVSVMKNPHDLKISPWYNLSTENKELKTSRYVFSPVVFKRF